MRLEREFKFDVSQEEEMRRLAEHRRLAVDLRPRLDQVLGIELLAAVVALVTACALEPEGDSLCRASSRITFSVQRAERDAASP